MPEMIEGMPRDVLIARCIVCGHAMYPQEIGGEVINGIYVDYFEHETGQFSGAFCKECWDRLISHSNEDMERAVDRRMKADDERDDHR